MATCLDSLTYALAEVPRTGGTLADVERIIRLVEAAGSTPADLRIVRDAFATFRDKFTAEAQNRLDSFLQTVQPAGLGAPGASQGVAVRGPPNPMASMKKPDVVWRELPERTELIENGISATDPLQRNIGDCPVIAAMCAVAAQRPDIIAKAFKENGDGTLFVTLYEHRNLKGAPEPIDIPVDRKLFTRLKDGVLVSLGATSNDLRELWPSLLEKAYATLKGGYDQLDRGGVGAIALVTLTGGKATDYWFTVNGRTRSTEEIATYMTTALKKGACMTASTHGDDAGVSFDPAETSLLSEHIYAVLKVRKRGKATLVQLRDPTNPKLLEVPIEVFSRYFSSVDVVTPPPRAASDRRQPGPQKK